MLLDIRTLSVILLLLALLYACALLLLQRGPRNMPGMGWWGAAFASAGLAFLLTTGRGLIPDLLSVLAANDLLLLSLFCFYRGVTEMRGRRDRLGWPVLLVLLCLLTPVLAWYTYGQPDLARRVVAVMLAHVVFIGLTVWQLLDKVPEALRMPHWFTAAGFLQLLLVSLFRAGYSLWRPPGDLMSSGGVQALGFLSVLLLVAMAAFGCMWMVSAYLAVELERQARTDPLTGAGNRHALDEALPRELKRSRRGGHPLALLLFDLDYFKLLNDERGHQQGDEALRQVVALTGKVLRESDLLVRYGGEEFLVLLPDTGRPGARRLAERLRRRLEEAAIDCGRGQRLTASFGLAVWPEDGDEREELIARADGRLYEAKQAGRNRVAG